MTSQAASPIATLIGTAILSLVTGYFLGLGSSIGFLPSPFSSSLSTLSTIGSGRVRSDLDEEESSSSEIDDDIVLDNAPNWANGEDADRRQGLRIQAVEEKESVKGKGKKGGKAAGKKEDEKLTEGKLEVKSPQKGSVEKREKMDWESSREECKLVLVVRTDLGMTKGKIAAQCGHATLACYKTLLDQKSPILRTWERLGQAKIALQIKGEEEMFELQARAMSLGITAEIIADAGRTQIASGSHTVLGIGPAPKSVIDAVTGHLKLL